MKVFIIGKHASGKLDVLNMLEDMGVCVGREFCNIPAITPTLYLDPQYERYTIDDVEKIFENKSYLCIGGIEESGVEDAYTYYRGISMYTYDNAEVIALRPEQLLSLNKAIINEEIIFVWLDNNRDVRIHKHVEDQRTYNFVEVEALESRFDAEFTKTLYNFPNSSVIYFTNELTERVAAIIAALLKHQDLKELFVKNFN